MAPEEERGPPSPRADLGGPPGGLQAGLYHERQRLELCALHALNNLLQGPWLSKRRADSICRQLSPASRPNPHRSPLGTGNYDVNLVMAALRMRGLAAVWWDRRRPLERLSLPHILGFLLNVRSRVHLGALPLPLRRPHWLGLRRLRGTFWNLDSKLQHPEPIGAETELRQFLRGALSHAGSELFLVVPQDVEEAGTWLSPEGPPGTPGDTLGTPGGTLGTPGDTLGTPGDTLGTSGDSLGTSGVTLGTSGDTLGTSGDTQETSEDTLGTSGDALGTLSDTQETSEDTLGTPRDTWDTLGTSGDTQRTAEDS